MKNTVVVLVCVLALASCKQKEYKFQAILAQWESEMDSINDAHGEALTILDGFTQKIDHHKEAIKSFGESIMERDAKTGLLSSIFKKKKMKEIDADLIKNMTENAKKHNHFITFLNGLTNVADGLENKPDGQKKMVEQLKIPASGDFNELMTFWTNEMDGINKSHDEGLAVIGNLKQHIENHENEISEFGYMVKESKKKADEALANGNSDVLEKLDAEIVANYDENMKKHAKFTTFLEGLKKVQTQFEN